MSLSPEAARESWTCDRCAVTASWAPDSDGAGCPANWSQEGDEVYCLVCRRARAGEAGLEASGEQTSNADRAKIRAAALVDFEVSRDPDRNNGQIARACRTSVPAVLKARQRLGSLGEASDA